MEPAGVRHDTAYAVAIAPAEPPPYDGRYGRPHPYAEEHERDGQVAGKRHRRQLNLSDSPHHESVGHIDQQGTRLRRYDRRGQT